MHKNPNTTAHRLQSRQQVESREVRHELARWIGILEQAELHALPAIIPPAKVAALALLRARPDLQLARKVRLRMELALQDGEGGTRPTTFH